jgi:hypothetical protein
MTISGAARRRVASENTSGLRLLTHLKRNSPPPPNVPGMSAYAYQEGTFVSSGPPGSRHGAPEAARPAATARARSRGRRTGGGMVCQEHTPTRHLTNPSSPSSPLRQPTPGASTMRRIRAIGGGAVYAATAQRSRKLRGSGRSVLPNCLISSMIFKPRATSRIRYGLIMTASPSSIVKVLSSFPVEKITRTSFMVRRKEATSVPRPPRARWTSMTAKSL